MEVSDGSGMRGRERDCRRRPKKEPRQKSVLGSDQHRGPVARWRITWRLGARGPTHSSGLCHSYLRSSLKMQIPGACHQRS